MKRIIFASLAIAAVALTGCSGSTDTTDKGDGGGGTTTTPETTVEIDGSKYTCEEITASEPQECGPFTQQAFDTYKENIDGYVRSGRLGPLNDANQFTYEDAAFAGLGACAIVLSGEGQNEYIDFMMDTPPFNDMLTERVMYLPAWFTAEDYLCTDLVFPALNMNPGSSAIP